MKKILNNPNEFVVEMLDGLLKAHPDQLELAGDDPHCIVRADAPVAGKVALATGGGSGHLPVFLGYVGKGLLDGCAIGNVFSSPTAEQMLEVTKAIDGGAGVLYLYGNYCGDTHELRHGRRDGRDGGHPVETVLVRDDVASAPPDERADAPRGGRALLRLQGRRRARPTRGRLARRGRGDRRRRRSPTPAPWAWRSRPAPCPPAGKPTFTIGEDEMEIGMGIHGEPGMQRGKLQTADQIATRMTEAILADLPPGRGRRGGGAGQRPRRHAAGGAVHPLPQGARDPDRAHGLTVHRAYVGEYATSMEMAGASLTFFRLDDELAALLDAPAHTPFFTQV